MREFRLSLSEDGHPRMEEVHSGYVVGGAWCLAEEARRALSVQDSIYCRIVKDLETQIDRLKEARQTK